MENWPREDANFFNIKCKENEIIKIITNTSLDEEFFYYAKNFKDAAYILVYDALKSNKISVLDINFFGIAFLYRHSIELLLKAIGFQYIKSNDDRKNFLQETFHNLHAILEYISKYIDGYINIDRDAFDWVMKFFHSMNNIDRESDSFRYPFRIVKKDYFDIYGKKNAEFSIKEFFEEQTHINLRSFAIKMDIIFNILKGYYLKKDTICQEYKNYEPIFLEKGGNYYEQSVVGDSYRRCTFIYNIQSYKNCANILYQSIIKDLQNNKHLFIPLCYLYRNSLELSIKEILFEESSHDYQKKLKLLNKYKHNMYKIWKSVKPDIIKHVNIREDDIILKYVENYIHKMNDFDGKADKFRYPTDKFLNLHFKTVKQFDLKNIRDFFEDILSFLYCTSISMSEQNQMSRELDYESEYWYEY